MKIEVFFFKGCPHYEPTMNVVREIISELGVAPQVEAIEVKDSEDARRLRFVGSPTIHVDGVDIEPAARTCTDFAMACRVYSGAGTPPRELLRTALSGNGSCCGG